MKRLLFAAAVVAVSITIPALADDTEVTVSIGEPGYYGRLDIGGYPQPQVINHQPMIIEKGSMIQPSIYLHVPPSHARHWKRHCGEYNACGERVFFVQDKWYKKEYVPRYQEQHRNIKDVRRHERSDNGPQNNNNRRNKVRDQGREQ